MGLKHILLGTLVIFFIIIMVVYWFVPFSQFQFSTNTNPEFNVGNISSEMQFYPNMRYPSSNISYHIDSNCSLRKKTDMTRAFNYLANLTVLNFYSVDNNQEITVSCDDQVKPSGNGYFVAGEGGPTKVIAGDNFYVIFKGKVLLLRSYSCSKPNIEIHELLHALGFNHSKNKNNIMYPISDCSQTLGTEIPQKIDELYSYPSYPDLKVANASAQIDGRYLNLNVSINNIGLNDSTSSKLFVYGDGVKIKEMNIKEIKIGEGLNVKLTNVWIPKRSIEKLNVSVENNGSELSLENNYVILTKLSS